jgi:hypothetical protein
LATIVTGYTEGPIRVGDAVRREIERFAEKSFAVVRDEIRKERTKKHNRALKQIHSRGNAAGHVSALIKEEKSFVAKLILARAKVYQETLMRYGLPSDSRVEDGLKKFAEQTTADSISAIRGLLARLNILEEGAGVPWHLEIEKMVDAALKKGLALLHRQQAELLKRPSFLERLPKDDPNFKIAQRFHLEAWADSHGIVADALGGKISFPDWVNSCTKSFEQAAAAQAAFTDSIPVEKKCEELDRMAEAFIHQFSTTIRKHSRRLGKAHVQAAIDHLSRRVNEISARSKQQIFQRALNEEQKPVALLNTQDEQTPVENRKLKKPVRRNQKSVLIDKALGEVAKSRPRTQEEVFQVLENRRVVLPLAELFVSARGWIAGFKRDEVAARAWLSKRWRELNLPPLPRGPKGLKNRE